MKVLANVQKTIFGPTILLFLFLFVTINPLRSNAGSGNVYVEPSVTLIDQNIKVSPATYMTYTLDNLPPGSKVGIKINVTGGTNNDILVYLLDSENYARFTRKQKFSTYMKNPKIVNQGAYALKLSQSGPFYLVLDNTNSIVSSKNVQVYVLNLLSQPLEQHEELKKSFDRFYGMLNQFFDFPGFDIYVKHCGGENAYSTPNVTICMELMEGLYKRDNLASLAWIMLHEVGHSLLCLWDYPLWDNEDVADEFATVFLLLGNDNETRIALRQAVNEWISKRSDLEAKAILKRSDRHSISIQRARNILNWERNADELRRRWLKIFVPHIKTPVLQQMKMKRETWIDINLIESELRKR